MDFPVKEQINEMEMWLAHVPRGYETSHFSFNDKYRLKYRILTQRGSRNIKACDKTSVIHVIKCSLMFVCV